MPRKHQELDKTFLVPPGWEEVTKPNYRYLLIVLGIAVAMIVVGLLTM